MTIFFLWGFIRWVDRNLYVLFMKILSDLCVYLHSVTVLILTLFHFFLLDLAL